VADTTHVNVGGSRGRCAAVARLTCILTLCGLAATAAPAAATPQSVLAQRLAQAKGVQKSIDALNRRADMLDEQYLEAQAAFADAGARIADAQTRLASGQRRADALRHRLAQRAAVLYIDGSPPAFALGTTDVRDLGASAQYGSAAQAQDVALQAAVVQANQDLRALRDDLERQQRAAKARQRKLRSVRKGLEEATARQRLLLASVNADVAGLIQEIEVQRAAAEELAARAKLTKQVPGLARIPVDPNIGADPGTFPALSPDAAAAVAFARAQIGDPYVYAAAGPDTWDCSGLTMVAWAHAGVTMEHNALAQFLSLPKVSLDQLAPGDLVFFGNPIHHVGIYVGAGTMIEAPHTGAFVRYASIFRDDLVLQAARP
jgi:peptidoglycan DL-endopeptidase CwlO